MPKPYQSLEDAEPALFWFARLETARRESNPDLVARAERELERLGYVVRLIRPISAAGQDHEVER